MNKIAFTFQFILLIVIWLLPIDNYAQEIPVGTWRTHISFNSIHSISFSTNKVYAASANGVMIFDKTDNSLSSISKLEGLSSTNITQVAVDNARQQVLISYADGDLDIVRATEIINYNGLKNSTTISGSKRINHINVIGTLAYLSTDYGVVVYDLVQLEVRETYRDLGVGGSKIKINQSTFHNDSIFLATEKGVLGGDPNDNLMDFNNWKRFNTGAFTGNIQSITTYNNAVYAAINGSGIYSYTNGAWTLESFSGGLQFKNLTAGTDLLITEGNNVWKLSEGTPLLSDKIVSPVIAVEDGSGKLWIGDNRNGLVSDKTESFEKYIPNGPSFSGGFKMKYDVASNKVFAVSGGYTSGAALLKTEYLNFFSDGSWNQETDIENKDLTDVEIVGSKMVVSSFGKGIQVIENIAISFEDETTSPNVTSLDASSSGVWVTNYGVAQSLHLLKSDNTWESFSFPTIPASRYPTQIEVDYLGNVWMVLSPENGGGILVFDKKNNQTAYVTEATGSGGLPSRNVYSIAMDQDGQVWIGTATGVAYFPDPSRVFSAGANAVKPIFENRFLLRDEKVVAIKVDGGNRKWMGSQRGVWLIDPIGEAQVYHFNTTNSPLLSDKIVDVEINQKTGEVFFMTDAGIVSFRSDATTSTGVFQSVKIFPNPVTANFNGLVAISGLATDAIVKITNIAGKLVWQTTANGGTATWNGRDYNGNRASTGMYLLISTSQDGSESIVGKIAVVD